MTTTGRLLLNQRASQTHRMARSDFPAEWNWGLDTTRQTLVLPGGVLEITRILGNRIKAHSKCMLRHEESLLVQEAHLYRWEQDAR